MKKKLITSSLPYVNNVPHLGNIIGSVLSADVYSKYSKLKGYPTLYICATDEYGTATEIKAKELKTTPEKICSEFRKIHKKVYDFFNISFDYFGKTSTKEHNFVTQDFFTKLEKNGYISEKEIEQTYCPNDMLFLADRFIEGKCPHCKSDKAKGDQCDTCGKLLDPQDLIEPKCKLCQTTPVLKKTKHLYFVIEKLKKELLDFTKSSSGWSKNALSTTLKLLENELEDKPITRDLKWGVPVPKAGYENKVFYVWFDAVLGYISATMEYLPKKWQEWWLSENTQLYQFMAKDNIIFHTVLLPAMMIGYKEKFWAKLYHINSSEYLNYETSKFSKSLKIGVFGDDVIKIGLPADLWRFYLLYNRPETSDSTFKWEQFFKDINTNLVDNLGNLLNRVCVFLEKHFYKTIDLGEKDLKIINFEYQEWIKFVLQEETKIEKYLEKVKLKSALHQIFSLIKAGNKLFQEEEPWKIIKNNKDKVRYLLYLLVALIKDLAIMLLPYIPQLAKKILINLNLEHLSNGANWKNIGNWEELKKHKIKNSELLLLKLDLKKIVEYKKKYSNI